MGRTILTPEQCGELLLEWVRRHCNSESVQRIGRDAGYKYSFFSPTKKLHLMEEVIFMYISLAVRGTNVALGRNYSTIEVAVDAFLAKARATILRRMASDDAAFSDRYTTRVGSYFELLRRGGDPMGVAWEFLSGLFGKSDVRLKLESSIKIVATVVASQADLQRLFEEIEVSGADDA